MSEQDLGDGGADRVRGAGRDAGAVDDLHRQLDEAFPTGSDRGGVDDGQRTEYIAYRLMVDLLGRDPDRVTGGSIVVSWVEEIETGDGLVETAMSMRLPDITAPNLAHRRA